MKLSDLPTAAEIHERDMRDPEYRREYERTKLANDVAVRVLAYRTEHGLSQTELGRRLGMRQPNIARLESGEHEPSLTTLVRLSSVLGVDFSIDINAGQLSLRQAPDARAAEVRRPRAKVPSRRRSAVALAALGGPRVTPPRGVALLQLLGVFVHLPPCRSMSSSGVPIQDISDTVGYKSPSDARARQLPPYTAASLQLASSKNIRFLA